MSLILHGTSDVSTTYSYGTCNWGAARMSKVSWLGGELENGSYLLAQLWLDTGNTTTTVSATYDITGAQASVRRTGHHAATWPWAGRCGGSQEKV